MHRLKNIVDVRTAVGLLAVVAWMGAAQGHASGPVWAALSTAFLLLVPGYYAYRVATSYRQTDRWMTLAYSTGLSVVILMLVGLAVNELFVWQRLADPLSLTPLANAVGGVTGLLVLLASLRQRPERLLRPLRWRKSWRDVAVVAAGTALPVLAVGGAFMLNNGGSNSLALIVMGLVGATFMLAATVKGGIAHLYTFILYSLALTILLSVSMRGWNITGHDIMQEFQVFQLTAGHSAWHMYYYQDAYNACLSITILPTVLQKLTGIASPYVFKLLFQLVFAMIAPTIYLSLRRYVRPLWALFAAFVFISFPTFLADMAMLNRQEMAFLCLGLALLAGLDLRMKPYQRQILTAIFLVGMVLSHYSTSYVAVGTLLAASGLRLAYVVGRRLWAMRQRRSLHDSPTLPIVSIPIVIITILAVFFWNTVATRTSGNIGTTLTGIVSSVPALLTHHAAPKAATAAPTTTAGKVAQFEAQATANRSLPTAAYYANAPKFQLSPARETVAPEASSLRHLHLPTGALYQLYALIKTLYGKLTQILILVGIGVLLLWRRRYAKLPTQYTVLGIGSLVVIATQVLLPSALVNYGLLRLIQQGLLVLALPIVVASFWLMNLARLPRRFQAVTFAAVLTGFYWALSGFLPGLTGGYTPALVASNSGFYYQAYYTHQDEIEADHWLATQTPVGSRVFSDEFARRKTITYGGIFPNPTLAPTAIPIDSYVYLSDSNTTSNVVPHYQNGDLIYYAVPYTFLNSDKNLIYSSGGVRVYR